MHRTRMKHFLHVPSRWDLESQTLGQVIFNTLGFIHIAINDLFCPDFDRTVENGRVYVAVQFGSVCRAATDVDSCTSVAHISVILR